MDYKFRVWNTDYVQKPVMEYFTLKEIFMIQPSYLHDKDTMLFSGLYDDEGREIYGKDIVEIHLEEETKTSYLSEVLISCNGVLVIHHPTHKNIGIDGYRLLSHYCDYGIGYNYGAHCKIVGNTYENPDLLKEMKYVIGETNNE